MNFKQNCKAKINFKRFKRYKVSFDSDTPPLCSECCFFEGCETKQGVRRAVDLRRRRLTTMRLEWNSNLFEPREVTKKKKALPTKCFFGADYGARTRHLHLGKVALYQMR